jgi:YbbR domain-containing protein
MKDVLKQIFYKNAGYKLLSIILALLGWCAIMNASDPSVTVTIKNVYVAKHNESAVTDENMIYEVASGETITVSVTGPRSVVQTLTASDLDAYIDLTELSITNACPIHVSLVNSDVAKSAEITSKSEEVVILNLEAMTTENKQIQVVLNGDAADGYYAAETTANPNLIEVYGSETQVSSIEKFIANVDISGKSSSFSTTADIVAVDVNGNELDMSKFDINGNKSVDIDVVLYKTKNINVVINADVDAEYGFAYTSIEQAPSSITIAGPADVINTITEIEIPYSAHGLKETLNDSISINDYIPEACYLVSDTDFVSITIPVSIMDSKRTVSTSLNNIQIKNIPDGFKVTNLNSVVNIDIWGIEGDVENINVKNLNFSVDLSGLSAAGAYDLPISMETDEKAIIDSQATVSVAIIPEASE